VNGRTQCHAADKKLSVMFFVPDLVVRLAIFLGQFQTASLADQQCSN
jgi:hypothetical protein